MDLYTLTSTFLADQTVDEFTSAIWVERYFAAGDVQLVVPATMANIIKLSPGTFLALRGSKEVMIIETQAIDKGLMTVTGSSLLGFLNQRYAWFSNPDSSDPSDRIVDYSEETTPGQFIANVVNKMVIAPVPFTSTYAPANLDWALDDIPNLSLGPVDTSGASQRLTAPVGPLYDSIRQVAEKLGVGISLYLDSADPVSGYSLEFTTYQGKDRTSDQSTYNLVRLTPDLDGLSDLKEINSNAAYKNVAYVYYQGVISIHYAEPTLPIPEGFARRVLVTNAEGEPVGHKVNTLIGYQGSPLYTYSVTEVDAADEAAFRAQNAKDALANNNYIHALDGQTSPDNAYHYGVDYGLGDLIELEGLTGVISKARITEYIRSKDKTGERNYPTIAVVS